VVVEYPSGARAMLDLCMFAENSMDNEHITVVGDEGKLESLLPSLQLRHGRREDWGRRQAWGQASGTGRGVSVRRVWDTNIKYPGHHFGASYIEHQRFAKRGARGPAGRDHAGGGPAQRHHRPGRAPFDRHRPAGAAQRTAAARLVMSDSPVCELRAGALRAAVRPDLGASLAGLWWQGEPLLRSCEPGLLAGPRQSACFALLPYSNRIGHCRFDWRGQSYRTRPNFDDHPHSLHGVGWQRAWTVTAHTPDRLQLGLRHEPDADWPFRLFGHPGAAAQRRRAACGA
jgi:hypothetical protein